MTYKVLLSPHAMRDYKKLNPEIRPRMQEAIDALRQQPLSGSKIKRLKGRLREYFRYRVEDYRIVYTVDQKEHAVYVDYVQHRREVYRGIE